jgi:type II secretion system protein D
MTLHRSLILLLLAALFATGLHAADPAPAATEPAATAPAATAPAAVTPAAVTPPPPAVPAAPVIPPKPPITIPKPPVTVPPAAAGTTPGGTIPGAVPPAPGGPASRPATNAAGPQPGIPLGENKILEDIVEPKLSGSALAGLYRKYTGRRVIVSAAASTAEFSFVQEASAKDPLTYDQAAELLKKAATIENFIFVPDEQDSNLDILTLASGGIRPTGRGVRVFNENDPLPEGDAVISYVMTLSYIKPAEAVNTFTQIIGQFGAFGSIAAVPNASAVVITENTSLIRKLIDLKKEIDKPSSQVATRFIKVQFADVTELADTLTELLTAQATAQKTAGIQRADTPAAPTAPTAPTAPGAPVVRVPGQPGASSSGEETPVQIIPEPRTNRIFAMGRPVDLLFVEGLVREFDVQTSDKIYLRRKLRFLAVSDFLPIAGDALTRAFSGSTEGGSAASGGSNKAGAGGQSNRSQTGSRNNSSGSRTNSSGSRTASNNSSSGFGGSGSGSGFGGSGGSAGGGSSLSDPNVSSAPESMLIGRTLLVADNITNTIVAQGPPSGLEIIDRLLDQIDVKPDQVMISTVIGLLALKNNKEFGMDYLYLGGDVVGRGGGGLGPVLPIVNALIPRTPAVGSPGDADYVPAVPAQNPFNPGTLTQEAGLKLYGKIGNNLNVFLRALQSKTDFTVLSRPSIFTSNNQKGSISSGESIPIIQQNNYQYGANNSVNYKDVVLKLEVIPLVNSNNEITMQIALFSDEVTDYQVVPNMGKVPNISTREILTTATVLNNETIVLGGLITSRDNQVKSGIPILCDIPLLGKLFSTTTNNKERSELMIFISPSIVNNNANLSDIQTDMDSRYKISPKARNFADGPGVLPDVNAIPRLDPAGKNGTPPKAQVVKESKTKKTR